MEKIQIGDTTVYKVDAAAPTRPKKRAKLFAGKPKKGQSVEPPVEVKEAPIPEAEEPIAEEAPILEAEQPAPRSDGHWKLLLGFLLGVVLTAGLFLCLSFYNQPQKANPTAQTVPESLTEHTDADGALTQWNDGRYAVGENLPEGTYLVMATGNTTGHFWICSDADRGHVIETQAFHYNQIISVYEGQYLELSHCYAVPYTDELPLDSKQTEGCFKIGVHLKPGVYKLKPVEKWGYYALYDGPLSGTQKTVSEADFQTGIRVEAHEGQYLVLNRCSLEYKSELPQAEPTETTQTGMEK